MLYILLLFFTLLVHGIDHVEFRNRQPNLKRIRKSPRLSLKNNHYNSFIPKIKKEFPIKKRIRKVTVENQKEKNQEFKNGNLKSENQIKKAINLSGDDFISYFSIINKLNSN